MSGQLAPDQRAVAATTAGISRNMQTPPPTARAARGAAPLSDGGGDLNGTAALIFFHQAGTAGDRLGLPRKFSTNYCGVI